LGPADGSLLLSALLRARTNLLHRQTEQLLGLPGAIRTRDDYAMWLGRFLGLYEPLECLLTGFPEWETRGIVLPSRGHSTCIAADLAALGVDPAGEMRAPAGLLPELPTFAHAFGALYVLEGATLGGRLILRHVEARLGAQIAGATRFFGGRGEAVGAMWQSFRAALDAFGHTRPLLQADVVTGAERSFQAILNWFAPFRAVLAAHL
jgi:heme oxygenase